MLKNCVAISAPLSFLTQHLEISFLRLTRNPSVNIFGLFQPDVFPFLSENLLLLFPSLTASMLTPHIRLLACCCFQRRLGAKLLMWCCWNIHIRCQKAPPKSASWWNIKHCVTHACAVSFQEDFNSEIHTDKSPKYQGSRACPHSLYAFTNRQQTQTCGLILKANDDSAIIPREITFENNSGFSLFLPLDKSETQTVQT